MINKQENIRKFIKLLELQADTLKEIRNQSENIEGDIVGLPKEVINNLADTAVVLLESANKQVISSDNNESSQAVKDVAANIMSMQRMGELTIDYIDSIGKLEDFTRYMLAKGIKLPVD